MNDAQPLYTVLCQQWEHYDRTLGVGPVGYSLHLNQEDHTAYAASHPREAAARYGRIDRPAGVPYWTEVDADTYAKVLKNSPGFYTSGLGSCPPPPPDRGYWPIPAKPRPAWGQHHGY